MTVHHYLRKLSPVDRKAVFWSDDSKFDIFGSNCRVFVRRGEGEHIVPQCMVPTVKHGVGGVMLWGYFAGNTGGQN